MDSTLSSPPFKYIRLRVRSNYRSESTTSVCSWILKVTQVKYQRKETKKKMVTSLFNIQCAINSFYSGFQNHANSEI